MSLCPKCCREVAPGARYRLVDGYKVHTACEARQLFVEATGGGGRSEFGRLPEDRVEAIQWLDELEAKGMEARIVALTLRQVQRRIGYGGRGGS